MSRPYFERIVNTNQRSEFACFDIQTVREFAEDGDLFFSVCREAGECASDHPDAVGPVLFGVYARFDSTKRPDWFGGVVHIRDFTCLSSAREFVGQLVGVLPIATS